MTSDELLPDIDLNELGIGVNISDVVPPGELKPSDLYFFRKTVRQLLKSMRHGYTSLATNRYVDVTLKPDEQEFQVDFGIVHTRKGIEHKTLEARMVGLIEVEVPPTISELKKKGLPVDATHSPEGVAYLTERMAILSAIIQSAGNASKVTYEAITLVNPVDFGRQIYDTLRKSEILKEPEAPAIDSNLVKQIHEDTTGHLPAKLRRSQTKKAPNIDAREGATVRWLAHEFAGRARKALKPWFNDVTLKVSPKTHNFKIVLQTNPEMVRGTPYSHLIDVSGKITFKGEADIALAERTRASKITLQIPEMDNSGNTFDIDIAKRGAAAVLAEKVTGVKKETPAPAKKSFAKRAKNRAGTLRTQALGSVTAPFASWRP